MFLGVKRKIMLVPVGVVPTKVFDWLEDAIPRTFGLVCATERGLPHCDFAWDARREQYWAEAILTKVQAGRSAYALAVADLDLFVPSLNFVFGLADDVMGRAIIALPRLRESYYRRQEDTALFRDRLIKEAFHELGHVIRLRHCHDSRCVMAFSNCLADTNFKSAVFCHSCRHRARLP